jgi:hypothetical protein
MRTPRSFYKYLGMLPIPFLLQEYSSYVNLWFAAFLYLYWNLLRIGWLLPRARVDASCFTTFIFMLNIFSFFERCKCLLKNYTPRSSEWRSRRIFLDRGIFLLWSCRHRSSPREEICHGQDRHWAHVQPWGGDTSYATVRIDTRHMSSPGEEIYHDQNR